MAARHRKQQRGEGTVTEEEKNKSSVKIKALETKKCINAHGQTYIHTDIDTYIHTYIQTYIHTYRHVYTQTDMYTYIQTYIQRKYKL